MRNVSWWVAGALGLLAMGCSGAGSSSPLAPVDPTAATPLPQASGTADFTPGQVGLGGRVIHTDVNQTALAIFEIDVDPSTLTATSRLKESRSGQATDDVYDLSIENFITPSTLQIHSITKGAGTVDLTYSVTHPFKAPSALAGPATAANRADLGIAGRVLFLADVADASGNTYFTDVVANTAMVANADGFFTPKGLLTASGAIANTYPFKALVDESQDSRTSSTSGAAISNGGQVTGNYDTLTGWQQSNIGAGNDGWSGYGVLHQGQTASNVVKFDETALAAGGFTFDAAILAKYADPRGGATGAAKKANRLPAATADVAQFVYREPHGALDLEAVRFISETGGFYTNEISGSELHFTVRDWDARATETIETDLALDTDPTKVAIGESGAPSLAVCIPGVLGDTTAEVILTESPDDDDAMIGGDAGIDSGIPGDELFYSELVNKTVISGQTDGTYTGMVKATDPEALADTTSWSRPLDPSLALLTGADVPLPVVYQAFEVSLITPNVAPSAIVTLTSSDPLLSGTSAGLSIASIIDADSDPLDILVDWGDGAGFVTVASGLADPYVTQTPAGPQMNNLDLATDTIDVVVRVDDGTVQTDYPLSYTLGANRAPVISGAPALATATIQAPASFTLNAGTATATDPEGDAITYVATASVAPTGPFGSGAFPIGSMGAYSTPGTVGFTLWARDPLHQNLVAAQADSATSFTAVNGTVVACAVAPFIAAPTTGPWNPSVATRAVNVATGNTWGYNDIAPILFPNNATPSGAVVTSNVSSNNTGPTYLPFNTQNFSRITAPAAGNPVIVPITAFTAAAPVIHAPNFEITDLMVHQIEVDLTGRVLFLTRAQGSDQAAPGGTDTDGTPGKYEPTGNLHAGIKWFDYNFTTNPAAVTTLGGTITTTGALPVATALNTVTHAIYTIDTAHMLRRYDRTGPTTYAESSTAAIDLAPIIGTNTGTGDTNRKVHEFVYDSYNQAFFILVQSRGVATTPGNGLVYRVECDGTFNTNLTGPNTNPVRFVLNASITQNIPADITIDDRLVSGASNGSEQDVQIIVGSNSVAAAAIDHRVLRANLLTTYTADTPGEIPCPLAVSFNNALYMKGSSYFTQYNYYRPGAAPAGWD